MTEKEIKQEVRALKKLKLACRAGTPERIDLGRKIKALKKQLPDISTPEPLKEPIIADILRIEAERKTIPTFEQLGINLQDYTLEQLKTHLKKLNTKRG
jgi:hypothetical protein